MNIVVSILSILTAVFVLLIPTLDARGGGFGGGGGGRGGGGGVGGGGRSVSRSPSMSRASPARPQVQPRPSPVQNRPISTATRSAVTGQGSLTQGQRLGGGTAARNDVQNFLQERSSTGGAAQAAARSTVARSSDGLGRPISQQQLGGRPNSQLSANRIAAARNVRSGIAQDRPNSRNWFNDSFWNQHRMQPAYSRGGGNWWRPATALGVSSWLGWPSTPVYYDYYPSNGSYYWGTSGGTGPVQNYAGTSQAIETATTQTGSNEWMSLGVFALTKEGETAVTPNMYMQLALNKAGQLSGTYYNATTDQTHEVAGMVQQNTQRAAWKIADSQNSPILETGVNNLTQPETPVRVHFVDGRTQGMVLVRLEQPNG